MEHEVYMRKALQLAREAAGQGEVPVGCVVVGADGEILGCGRNRREENCSVTGHAELEAMEMAEKALGNWRLDGCSLYVTLEPCPMCAGAILNARVGKVFYGARDPAMGACGGVFNLFYEKLGHEPQLMGGILKEECAGVLADFFQKRREE